MKTCNLCSYLDKEHRICSCKHSKNFGWDGLENSAICRWFEGDDTYDHDHEKEVAYLDDRSSRLEQSHYDRMGGR